MYDFHSHIIPRLDHGSPNAETAKKQIVLLESLAVSHAVATPHFSPDSESVDDFLARRARGEDSLRRQAEGHSIVLHVGAEVLITEGIDRMEGLDRLCIRGTDILLLEMPFFEWNDNLRRTAKRLCHSSLTVLLAHVDRYAREDVEELFDAGALGQINCDALARMFPKRYYTDWIRGGACVALGTDLHIPDHFKKKTVRTAEKRLGAELAAHLERVGGELLADAERIN